MSKALRLNNRNVWCISIRQTITDIPSFTTICDVNKLTVNCPNIANYKLYIPKPEGELPWDCFTAKLAYKKKKVYVENYTKAIHNYITIKFILQTS